MQFFARFFLVSLGSVALAACSSTGPVAMAPGIQRVDLATLPTPTADENAVIRPLDRLNINVLGFPELSREVQVDGTGDFQFPLIGLVQADGKTPLAISRDIAARLRGSYVIDPDVTVDPVEQEGRLITLGGQVDRPGRYPVVQSLSLLEAVATAGGTTETAKLEDVVIFREVDGQRYIGVYNLEAIGRGNLADPKVYPGDIIQVGDSPTLRRIRTIASISPLITAPIILLERILR